MYRHLAIFLLVGCFSNAYSQNRLRVSGEYSFPLGRMNWSYKNSPGIQVSFVKADRKSKTLSKLWGVGIGYTRFRPLADTLYYVVDEGGISGINLGRAVFSPFSLYTVSCLIGVEKQVIKKHALCLEFAAGYYYGKRDISIEDDSGGSNEVGEFIGRAAMVPRIGFAFAINEKVRVSPFASYTLMIEVGSTDAQAMNYNPNTGAILHYYSAGLSLDYKF